MRPAQLQPHNLGSVTVPGAQFEIGALYMRRSIHQLLGGGGQQAGITRVRNSTVTLLFTGLSGRSHGYFDSWDDTGNMHYYGEGQVGDMQLAGGNSAIVQHLNEGRRLLVFQALGKGLPVRFLGEFCYQQHYERDGPDRTGALRKALVFVLRPVAQQSFTEIDDLAAPLMAGTDLHSSGPTASLQVASIRQKQEIFRRRLTSVEAGCRLTGVADLRFLRASHMKPWAVSDDIERVSRDNGLLLTPSADLLFDRGWISFHDTGELLLAQSLPAPVKDRIGLDLTPGRDCGGFSPDQVRFLEYHRDCIFEQETRYVDLP